MFKRQTEKQAEQCFYIQHANAINLGLKYKLINTFFCLQPFRACSLHFQESNYLYFINEKNTHTTIG
ncbi:hypothetical protein FGO68_gene10010 [Halteria grandinella]|uniref:Uncharacterized protein n=1 Tax=Halteria grandinella TaxID=5974 RepID=A0A8J8NCN9_HALGN|nr:hypothetical protein FGO68_gene10010 [Halteria grandinella]